MFNKIFSATRLNYGTQMLPRPANYSWILILIQKISNYSKSILSRRTSKPRANHLSKVTPSKLMILLWDSKKVLKKRVKWASQWSTKTANLNMSSTLGWTTGHLTSNMALATTQVLMISDQSTICLLTYHTVKLKEVRFTMENSCQRWLSTMRIKIQNKWDFKRKEVWRQPYMSLLIKIFK